MVTHAKSKAYLCHKWFLFWMCLLYMVANILILVYCDEITRSISSDADASAIEAGFRSEAIVSIFFSMFGVLGASRENYCLTVTFSVYVMLCLLMEVFVALIEHSYWYLCTTIIYLTITVLSVGFARRVRMRLLEINRESSTDFGVQYAARQSMPSCVIHYSNYQQSLDMNVNTETQLPPYSPPNYSEINNTPVVQQWDAPPPYKPNAH